MEQAAFDKKYIALRREFHRYPEPAWLEYRTTARIIQHLEELGLRPRWGRDIHQAEARMGLPGADTDAAWLARAVEETGRGDRSGLIYASDAADDQVQDGVKGGA